MPTKPRGGRVPASQVEVVVAASRVFVGVVAQSIADLEDTVTVPQLRALMIIATRGPMHLGALAEEMGVHPSNATRACDRLVAAGLLHRRDNPADRRHLLLEQSPAGRNLIDHVLARRRRGIETILRRMAPDDRTQLVEALQRFADAGGEPAPQDLWALGWIS